VGRTALQQGAIFGLIQAVIASVILLINTFVEPGLGVSLLLTILSFLTGLAAYFVSGILAVKQTGRVRTGTFAGMWAGGIYGTIDFVLSLILFFAVNMTKELNAAINAGAYTDNIDAYKTGLIIGSVLIAFFGLCFAIGLGAGLGALGGLIGRNISPYKQVQIASAALPVYSPYPGQPAYPFPGQPVYPAQTYYPGQVAAPPPLSSEQIYIEQPVPPPGDQSPQ
jgi:hypothetical protein